MTFFVGTGKTMLGKALGKEFPKCTFIKANASDLLDKYVGGAEKNLKLIFEIAEKLAPTILLIDEINGLMADKSKQGNLLNMVNVLLDLTSTLPEKKIYLIGCTNYPQNIEEAFMRRFTKKILVPLPKEEDRELLIINLLKQERHTLDVSQIKLFAQITENYTPSEITAILLKAADVVWAATRESKYFKPTIFKSGFFTPCLQCEVFSIETTYLDLPKKSLLPVQFTFNDIKRILQHHPPATKLDNLDVLNKWGDNNQS